MKRIIIVYSLMSSTSLFLIKNSHVYLTFYEIQKKSSFSERWWLTLSSEMGLDKTLNYGHSVSNIVYPLTFLREFWMHSSNRICFMHIITSAALLTNCAYNRQ